MKSVLLYGGILLMVVVGGVALTNRDSWLQAPTVETQTPEEKRFVSLKKGEGNVRTGPDHRYYPIKWVFTWSGLPVHVVRTYKQGTWYYIRDWKGNEGWIHRHYFSNRRTVIVIDGLQTLYRTRSRSRPIALVEEGVIGTLKECRPEGWCRAEFQTYDGWMPRESLWGVDDPDFPPRR